MLLNEPRIRSFPGLTLAGLAVCIALVAFGVYTRWRDEARAVRRCVQEAAEAMSSRPGEAEIERMARLAGLAKRLARDVVVEAEAGGPAVRGREAVAGLASRLSAVAGVQAVTLSDIEVSFNDVRTLATVTAVAHVTSSSPGTPQTYDGQVIHLELTTQDGPWLISRVRPEPALDR